MMDSLEIIASCDLEFSLYSKLNQYMNDRAYTRPRYQVSVYKTIGPLVKRVIEIFVANFSFT